MNIWPTLSCLDPTIELCQILCDILDIPFCCLQILQIVKNQNIVITFLYLGWHYFEESHTWFYG
jgi:hypothetical protein